MSAIKKNLPTALTLPLFAMLLAGCGQSPQSPAESDADSAARGQLRQILQAQQQPQQLPAGTTVNNSSNPIVGKWRNSYGSVFEQFNANGTGNSTAFNSAGQEIEDRLFTWTTSNGTVNEIYSTDLIDAKDDYGIKSLGMTINYSYSIDGDTLHRNFGSELGLGNQMDEYRVQ